MFLRSFVVFLLSWVVSLSVFADDLLPDHIGGALCLVRADNQIVLVDEIITGQLSLPGGTITPGEPAYLAAQRETWEEAGLAVTVGDVLGYTDGAVIFDCQSDSEIISYQARNERGGFELPIWFAPHYGVEVSRAMLLAPSELDARAYRYPEQWGQIQALFKQSKNQPVTYVDELIGAAPTIHQAELSWIISLQNTINLLPNVVGASILLTDILLQPWIFIVILPLIAWYFGRNFTLKFGFTLISVTLLTLVAHQGFGFPRPHAYMPLLKFVNSSGYSFPSTASALWTSLTLLVLWKADKLHSNKYLGCAIFGLAWILLFKTYSGSAFASDILVGAIVGALAMWHIVRLDNKPNINISELLSSKSIWWGMSLIAVVLTVIWPLPTFTFWLAMLLTIAGLVTLTHSNPLKTLPPKRVVVVVIGCLLVINGMVSWLGSFITYSGIGSLIVDTVRFPLLILFGVIAFRLPWKARSKHE